MNELHVPAPPGAPRNPVRGVPLASRDGAMRERLATGLVPDTAAITALWQRLLAGPAWAGPPLWLHGDPHPANVLVHRHRPGDRLGWPPSSTSVTSPAAIRPPTWPRAGCSSVHEAGPRSVRTWTIADDATWQRARGWALNMGAAIAVNSADNPAMAAIGAHALAQVLLEED